MKRAGALMLVIVLNVACEDDKLVSTNPYNPYEDGNTTVIGGDEMVPVASGQVSSGDCLQVTTDTCVPVTRDGRYCKTDTGPADAVVVDGMVVQVVCYEDTDGKAGTDVVVNNNGNVDVPQQNNGAVITFDPSTDGKPIEGNVSVDGNNVTIYGNGPDKTIIHGDLHITGNNARVRGVRITGNVDISLNTASILFCIIEGNLEVNYNNCLVAENQIFGNVKIEGNNTILVNNDVQGNWEINGQGEICDGNRAFMDKNSDKAVQETEYGAALTCPGQM